MRFQRFWFAGLATIALMLILSAGIGARVQADTLLQDVPRLDGINVYFTEAGGEASRFDRGLAGLSRFAGLLRELGANLFTLEWRTTFPTDADLIVIAGPSTDFSPDQTARLWSYVNNGGSLLLLANPPVEARNALPSATGLFSLMWTDMGIRGLNDVVVTEGDLQPIFAEATEEAESAAEATDEATDEPTSVGTPQPLATANLIQVGERETLVAEFSTDRYASHPITDALTEAVTFFTARSLEVDSSIQGFEVTPLVFTDEDFYGESDYTTYVSAGTFEFNIGADTTMGSLPLAAAYNNDETGARIVLVGDREFITNGGGFRSSPPNTPAFVFPANVRFSLNAVTWLLESEAVDLDFPTPAPTATVTLTPSPTPSRTPTPAS